MPRVWILRFDDRAFEKIYLPSDLANGSANLMDHDVDHLAQILPT